MTETVMTTQYFWDCECEKDYIRHKTEKNCPLCGAIREEQPDSIVKEVLALRGEKL
jgi:hypothetical protein